MRLGYGLLVAICLLALPLHPAVAQSGAISVQGLESEGEGTAAWDADGTGPEPAASGHVIDWTGCSTNAYYYLATRDYVDATASYGVQGLSIDSGFDQFNAALSDGGYTIADFTITHGLLSLGDDIEDEDWSYDPDTATETRTYAGTTTMQLYLDGELMATAPLTEITIFIDYNNLSGCSDDQIFGFSEYVLPEDATTESTPQTIRDAAAAFVSDVGDFGVRFDFDSIQPAAQLDFTSEGRSGAFFDVQGTHEVGDTPLPVELTAFEALLDGPNALLRWTTASETNNAGFEVQVREERGGKGEEGAWQVLGWMDGHGTTAEPQTYRHRVADLAPGTHRFRLRQVDFDGTFAYSPTVEVRVTPDGASTPVAWSVYPNPMREAGTVEVVAAHTQPVRIALFDVVGRRVAVLHDGPLHAGAVRRLPIPASTLPRGLYVVRAEGPALVTAQPVVVR